MSRYVFYLPGKMITECLRIIVPDFPDLSEINRVETAFGYDKPCSAYFLDFFPDEEEDCVPGIWCGGIGTNTQVTDEQFKRTLRNLADRSGSKMLSLQVDLLFPEDVVERLLKF